jgi:hypothetical protein
MMRYLEMMAANSEQILNFPVSNEESLGLVD